MVFSRVLRAIATTGAVVLGAAALAAPASPAAAATPCGDVATRPWCNTALTADQRAGLLVAQLTLDEKISLMAGDDFLGGPLGGFTDSWHTGVSKGLTRLGIPDTNFTDGPLGVRQGLATAMPAPLALGATFDPAAAQKYGTVLGNEAKLKGNDVLFGPGLDVLRTPLNGRAFEGFGEDPDLTATLGVPWIKGAQGEGVTVSAKHFAVYTQETKRDAVNQKVDDRTLREIYLPSFEAAVKQGGVGMVMCAHPALNGVDACGDSKLNQQILRGEWGFQGALVSDYLASPEDQAVGVNGGLDLEMPIGQRYTASSLKDALAKKTITEATLTTRVRTILRTMFAGGQFDRAPYVLNDAAVDRTGHDATARSIEEGAITLLQNTGNVLPLKAPKKIAVIGGVADKYKGGVGSSQVRPTTTVTPLAGIKARAGAGTQVSYNDGGIPFVAANFAKDADVAVVFVEDERGEFSDKDCLTLRCGKTSGVDQDELIRTVAAAQPNTIVVLETGGPVLTPWRSQVKGIVEAWYPGQSGGTSIARMLFGDVDPGGRLPVTFPAAAGDIPASGSAAQFPGVDGVETFSEGVLVGYRHYDAKGLTPAFAFGSGLSYTSFRYSNLQISGSTVRATVTNTGSRSGVAVPQLYVNLPSSPGAAQPPRQLKGFQKVTLAPGASTTVSFPLTERDLSVWKNDAWTVVPGCYRVQVGSSSRDLPLSGALRGC